MKDLKVCEDENYIVKYSSSLEGFIQDELALANRQRQKMVELFDGDICKVKVAIFDDQKEFMDYVENLCNGKWRPHQNTSGCFCNGEIQASIDPKTSLNWQHGVIAHETCHLFIQKLIYQPLNIPRIKWFDESFAYYSENKWPNTSINFKWQTINRLKNFIDTDLNKFDKKDEIANELNQNFVPIMRIVGQYIFDTNAAKTLLEVLKKEPDKIREFGKTLLKDSIDYFEERLKEKT